MERADHGLTLSSEPLVRFQELVADVEATFGVTLTIHDGCGVFRTGDSSSLVGTRGSHTHPYCQMGRRSTPGWDQNCWDHCVTYVETRAGEEQRPFVTRCWKGTCELIVPVLRDGRHVATIFAGAFRDPRGRGRPGGRSFPEGVRRTYDALPALVRGEAARVARILHTLGQGLLNEVNQIHLIRETELDRQSIIRRFVYYRAQERVTLADLARTLSLSASRTSHVVRDLCGVSFQELLVRERIQRAQALLVSSPCTVGEIARRVGLPDEYYFNRLFKKVVGVPPGRFRRRRR